MKFVKYCAWITILVLWALDTSCTNDSMACRVRNVLGNSICLPSELSDTISEYRIVRYIKSNSCTSCQLELGMWRVYKKRLNKVFGDKVNIKFIISTKKIDEVTQLITMYQFHSNVYIDSVGTYINDNNELTGLGSDVVVLTDQQNRVLLIGNPCKNYKIQCTIDSILFNNLNGDND